MADNYPFDSSNVPYSAVFNQDYTADSALAVSTVAAAATAVSLITIAGGAGGTSAGVGGTGGSVTLLDSAYSTSRGKYSGGDGGTGGGALGNGAGGGGAAGYAGVGGDAGSGAAANSGGGGGGGASTNQLLLGGGGVGLFGKGTTGAAGTTSAAAGGGSPGGSDSAQGGFDGFFDSAGAQPNYIILSPPTGLSSDQAATSAAQILSDYPSSTDGVYWIDLPTVGPTQIYCLMDTNYDGGGWMLAMKATTGTTFNYSANYWTTNNTLNPTQNNLNNGNAKFNTMNYFAATDLLATWPDLGVSGSNSGSISGRSKWNWHQNDFNGGTSQTLISFFTSPSGLTQTSGGGGQGYYISDASSFAGRATGGVTKFSSQTDIRFYGFNYVSNQTTSYAHNAKVRWGFGWNENGEGAWPGSNVSYRGSNDVSGGIGMDTNYDNYSAGDHINCCSNSTGVNRSARVELWIR